jgi:hypothetical protein
MRGHPSRLAITRERSQTTIQRSEATTLERPPQLEPTRRRSASIVVEAHAWVGAVGHPDRRVDELAPGGLDRREGQPQDDYYRWRRI